MYSTFPASLVADREANVYPRLGLTMKWDTGSSHAITSVSGKSLKKYTGGVCREHKYNKENPVNKYFW